MLFKQDIGIVAYGAYLPSLVIAAEEIEAAQGKVGQGIAKSLGVMQKTVPEVDEDTVTLATAAASQALERWKGNREDIGAFFIGSESHPYAVKPTGTIVKEALGLPQQMALADLQFACKAGTQSLQICASYVASEMAQIGLAIGSDTAQSRPGDVLEFTAGAGAAAYLLGKEKILVKLLATTSLVTDTPDFWRRPGQDYPEHAGRFSGEPGYFFHVLENTKKLLEEVALQPKDIDHCVFHTPNAKFPQAAAARLRFSNEQLAPSLVVKKIGNTYAAASLVALAAVLDQAKAGQKILVTSYGSGAGSDCFLLETTPELIEQRQHWSSFVTDMIEKTQNISYQEYRKSTSASEHGKH